MDTEITNSCNYHVSQNAILLGFWETFKNAKAIFSSSQTLQNQAAGWTHPGLDPGVAWPNGVFENLEN